jgi:hypothetical protein
MPDIILPQFIDSTMLNCFRTCNQRFFDEFVLGLRPAEISIHLHAGGAFSGAMEQFYQNFWTEGAVGYRNQRTALSAALPKFLSLWGDFSPSKPTPKTRENIWNAVEAYLEKWPAETDHVQPLEFNKRKTVEFSFGIPLDFPGFPRHPVSNDPFIYCGRIDLLGTYNGRTCIRDEKTTGRLEANWASQWDLRSQFLGYCWGCTVSGIPCDTAVVRGIVIHKHDINLVEAIKLYGQWEIDRWFEQLRRDLNAIVRCFNEKWWNFNLGEACTMWGGCSFADLCKSQHPERWYDSYKTKRWNPLDRNPINSEQGV